ncbi:MAG: iron ABC transporter permease [Sphaerochaetaceae bacterium]|nr:iron ABC transporter permease [Sphaerochaetaceae bacterium]
MNKNIFSKIGDKWREITTPNFDNPELRKKKDFSRFIVYIIPAAFLCIFLFYPLFTTLIRAFMSASKGKYDFSTLGFDGFIKLFNSGMFRKSLRNSFVVSVSVTFLTILIGVPMGYFVARVDIPGKKMIKSLGLLPIIMPAFIGAFSWIILLGNQGSLRLVLSKIGIGVPSIYGISGIIFVMTMVYYPFVFLLAEGAFGSANAQLEDSAMLMGASRGRILRTITLPLIVPSIGAAALLVFIRSIGNFGIPSILGKDQYVLPTLIYFKINGFWDLNGASSIALVNVTITALVLYLQKKIVSRHDYETVSAARTEIKQADNKIVKIIATVFCWLILIVSLLPQITIIIMSFFTEWTGPLPTGFTFGNYSMIPSNSNREFLNSIYLSVVATILAAVLGSLIAYVTGRIKPKGGAILDMAIMAPFILPGTVVSVALISSFGTLIGGTYTIIIISFIIRRTPYVYRSVSASLTQMSPSLEEASTIAGGNWFYTFKKVTIPIIMPGIISGSLLTFTTLLQELSTTILLYSAKTRTVPVQIYGAVVDGALGQASALSVILLVIVFILVYISNNSNKANISAGLKLS